MRPKINDGQKLVGEGQGQLNVTRMTVNVAAIYARQSILPHVTWHKSDQSADHVVVSDMTKSITNSTNQQHWSIMPRLHQDTCCPETCSPDEQLVSGYIYVDGHIRRIHVVRSGYMLTVSRRHNLLVTVDLYPSVSSNRRDTNWWQFCRRHKKHVDGNKWIHVDTTGIRQHVSWCKRGVSVYFA